MKFKEDASAEKLRGGYYTPRSIVDWCIERVANLRAGMDSEDWLEPSVGDGAFIEGLLRHPMASNGVAINFTGVELIPEEANKSSLKLNAGLVNGNVYNKSFLAYATENNRSFDVAVGNPPFVRYQFVSEEDRALAAAATKTIGVDLRRVSNLWIPFLLLSLGMLRPEGAFAFVVPSEFLSTMSAGTFRSYLVTHFRQIRVDMFPREAFEDLLQDVVVISGTKARRKAGRRDVVFAEHKETGLEEWSHSVAACESAWMEYLLSPAELAHYREVISLACVRNFSEVARLEVSIVTGANKFFTISEEIAQGFGLNEWCIPLLPRTSDSQGIIYTEQDWEDTRRAGRPCWLLDFNKTKPDPYKNKGAARYLSAGEAQGLQSRYKCRIRKPWYRVPHIAKGTLMMSKRSHQHHRLILNAGEVYTTDTIYRGKVLGERFSPQDIVASFHNSLTLLSSELQGRTYGGGVLELVPGEIARLLIPICPMGEHLEKLDKISRASGGQIDKGDQLILATNELLKVELPELAEHLDVLESARRKLRHRRFYGLDSSL